MILKLKSPTATHSAQRIRVQLSEHAGNPAPVDSRGRSVIAKLAGIDY